MNSLLLDPACIKRLTKYSRIGMSSSEINPVISFFAGGLALCGAVTFTNPLEVIKTRLQLQGELARDAPRLYNGTFHGLKVVYQREGLRALQKGLGCAYIYQICLNGCRLGLYEPTRQVIASLIGEGLPLAMLAGTVTGAAGAISGNPFFLIKTRMQSYGGAAVAHVGTQTRYTLLVHALLLIAKTEGLGGWYRGVNAAIIRTGAGSSVQLPIYNTAKRLLGFEDGPVLHLCASMCSGLGVAVVMNPFDVVLTRLYNTSGGVYKGVWDCMLRTVRAEGPGALYKGFSAQALRVGPHTVLSLVFMEQTMKGARWLSQKADSKV